METLLTDRLVLRPYSLKDRASFVALNRDEAVRKFMGGPLSAQQSQASFERLREGAGNASPLAWAVIQQTTSTYVGHAFIERNHDDGDPEIGFLFLQAFWGQGFATETARCLLAFLAAGGTTRAMATVDVDHAASRRVLEKTGFELAEIREDDEGPYCYYTCSLPSET